MIEREVFVFRAAVFNNGLLGGDVQLRLSNVPPPLLPGIYGIALPWHRAHDGALYGRGSHRREHLHGEGERARPRSARHPRGIRALLAPLVRLVPPPRAGDDAYLVLGLLALRPFGRHGHVDGGLLPHRGANRFARGVSTVCRSRSPANALGMMVPTTANGKTTEAKRGKPVVNQSGPIRRGMTIAMAITGTTSVKMIRRRLFRSPNLFLGKLVKEFSHYTIV